MGSADGAIRGDGPGNDGQDRGHEKSSWIASGKNPAGLFEVLRVTQTGRPVTRELGLVQNFMPAVSSYVRGWTYIFCKMCGMPLP
jgi:hypothetical protein